MDGFHLVNLVLKELGLFDRKRSPNTFAVPAFIKAMQCLAAHETDVAIPEFDWRKDISIEGVSTVFTQDEILIVEWNYLFLKVKKWAELQPIWDETIFINPGMDILEKG